MKLLVDTNIFLEVILDQQKAADVRALIAENQVHEFFISDYSLHSVGLLLFRRNKHDAFLQFLRDMVLNVGVSIAALSAENMEVVINAARKFKLDFVD